MNRRTCLCLVILAMAAIVPAGPAASHEFTAGSLVIIHPTARPNLPNRPMAAYVTIANDGDVPDRLVAVSAPGFTAAEIHESRMQGTAMTMQRVTAVDLPAHDAVVFGPGGLHIMLFGAAHQFKPGESFPMILQFEAAGEARVDVVVEKPAAGQAGGMAPGHGHAGHGSGQSGN